MNDLERELRELLETKSRDASVAPTPSARVVKRVRRWQLGTALTAVVGVAALVGATVFGVQAVVGRDPLRPRPTEQPVLADAPEGFRAAAMPFVSIAYPQGWFLLELDPDVNRRHVLQLTNFDPELGRLDCEAGDRLPAGGVMLELQLGATMDPLPQWPTPLDVMPGWTRPCGANGIFGASWSVGGERTYSATGLLADGASAADGDLMTAAFESMEFPIGMSEQMEELLGRSNLILDAAMTPMGPATLYAYVDDFEGGSAWVGVAGPEGSGISGGAQIGGEVPTSDENVTMNLDTWGGVVWGTVAAIVERAELRTVEGGTYPATLVPMPPSLGVEGHQIAWGVLDVVTEDRVTTLLYDAQGRVLNTYYPTAPRTVIASGMDPEGGPWELYLDHTDEGTGLGFAFEMGGGGGGCCLRPLEGDFRLDGWGTGGGEPANITAFGSEALDHVVFEAASGAQIAGDVFPIPDKSLSIPKVALVLVPAEIPLEGDLVAYDAAGDEIGREFVGDHEEPAGPTPEIDVVWQSLRKARESASRFLEREGTFVGLTPERLSEMTPEITTATRPEPEAVSIYVTDELHLVVSSSAITGEEFCIAVEADGPQGGFNYRYGSVFADTYDECRGGWFPD